MSLLLRLAKYAVHISKELLVALFNHVFSSRMARTESPQTLYLRIHLSFVSQLLAPTADEPNPQVLPPLSGTTGNLTVIAADLCDIRHFAGNTTDWLIKVARLIFDPLGNGNLYTFTTGTVESWSDADFDESSWRLVEPTEPLNATIYEFRPNGNVLVIPSKISLRHQRSRISTGSDSINRSSAFRTELIQRDQTCVITHEQSNHLLVASHLIPKHLGDANTRAAIQRFAGSESPTPDPVPGYSPAIGVLLFVALDAAVDRYLLGFWNNGQDNQYVIHDFNDKPINIYGASIHKTKRYHWSSLLQGQQMLHGHRVTLSSHDTSVSLPPVGVFNWHYLQCVLKKFATNEYRGLQNIAYHSIPFHTGGYLNSDDSQDDDWDFDDKGNIEEFPYPSYPWDVAMMKAAQFKEAEERNHAIEKWMLSE